MNLASLVANLERQLRRAQKLALRYTSEAEDLERRLDIIAEHVGATTSTRGRKGKAKRKMSRAGRARIRAAIKKRWAAYRSGRGPKPGTKVVRKKRRFKMSASHKKALRAGLKRRWAKFRAAKKGE